MVFLPYLPASTTDVNLQRTSRISIGFGDGFKDNAGPGMTLDAIDGIEHFRGRQGADVTRQGIWQQALSLSLLELDIDAGNA